MKSPRTVDELPFASELRSLPDGEGSGGLEIDGDYDRVLFRGCKLDSVNFRDSKLTDVAFEDCVLRDVDFGSARLLRVRFGGSTLVNTEFTHATCREVDLRGARLGTHDTPGIKGGYASLAGVQIDMPQLMTLAPLLAHHLGIVVSD